MLPMVLLVGKRNQDIDHYDGSKYELQHVLTIFKTKTYTIEMVYLPPFQKPIPRLAIFI